MCPKHYPLYPPLPLQYPVVLVGPGCGPGYLYSKGRDVTTVREYHRNDHRYGSGRGGTPGYYRVLPSDRNIPHTHGVYTRGWGRGETVA